jgi:AhpD family alkylhydroperoxidase
MTKDYKQITQDLSKQLGSLRNVAPMKGFSDLAAEATKAGALDEKTKEFIALAIGVTQHCDGCIGFHAKKLAALGATKEEIAETLAMCTYMGGGPALMYAGDAWKAFEQFSEDS